MEVYIKLYIMYKNQIHMKKILMTILLSILIFISYSQTVDTIIDKGIYKSYFCKKYQEPLYVTYKLYKAGGKGSRVGMTFKNDTKLKTATPKGYKASGYDEGHLADAADFSGNKEQETSTFMFYNALPQTANLNRGIWKHYETIIREDSQSDQLLIICGGIFSENSKKLSDGSYVPDQCWKIEYSYTKKALVRVMIFANDMKNATEKDITLDDLIKITGYPLKDLIK
jgi:DNA/RNA endonuclease G (NUC1)